MADLVCVECDARADAQAIGWQAYLVAGDDGPDEPVFYCPECAAREFGDATASCD